MSLACPRYYSLGNGIGAEAETEAEAETDADAVIGALAAAAFGIRC